MAEVMVITTITSIIDTESVNYDLDHIETNHLIEINSPDGMSEGFTKAIVLSAATSLMDTVK